MHGGARFAVVEVLLNEEARFPTAVEFTGNDAESCSVENEGTGA